ncbi:HK97 gp10 family phage protein [Diaphorobacter sp. HDW4B]|uniref:HK97-gp10 family putative phage morphogenesis protein n=1 Tax=Diaphorobacter sp. HDW4B TaxID=2714925 RepID=UPI00140A8D4B|nr:HK97-gp10 family putative phage morphogenesis protein [Diaphorobacter sp. HDW4B]QIL71667.1 HK97 gp10 family phage protein [Diaphorobacter sp. HDW4B]
MSIKVKGLKELAQVMHELPDKLANNVMRSAMATGARVVRDEAKRNVPVDQGALKKSFDVSSRVDKANGIVTAKVKATNFKAVWIEYGTAAHWISIDPAERPTKVTRRGIRKVGMKTLNNMAKAGSLRIGEHFIGASVAHPGGRAQPYMRPALDSKAQEAVAAVGNYMKKRLTTKHGLDTSGIDVEAEEE